MSSVFKVAMKLSSITLSSAIPVLTIEGAMPTSARRLGKALGERDRRVLDATIGMMHEAHVWFAPLDRHLRGVDHELGPHRESIEQPTILLEWVSRMKAR